MFKCRIPVIHKRNWLKEHIKQGIFLLLAIAYIIILVLNGNTAMNGLESGNYPFLYYFEILLGSIVILVIFRKNRIQAFKADHMDWTKYDCSSDYTSDSIGTDLLLMNIHLDC